MCWYKMLHAERHCACNAFSATRPNRERRREITWPETRPKMVSDRTIHWYHWFHSLWNKSDSSFARMRGASKTTAVADVRSRLTVRTRQSLVRQVHKVWVCPALSCFVAAFDYRPRSLGMRTKWESRSSSSPQLLSFSANLRCLRVRMCWGLSAWHKASLAEGSIRLTSSKSLNLSWQFSQ